MANKMSANSAITISTTESNRQVRQPNTIDFAIKYYKHYAKFWKIKGWFGGNKNPTIFSWDLMELLTRLELVTSSLPRMCSTD